MNSRLVPEFCLCSTAGEGEVYRLDFAWIVDVNVDLFPSLCMVLLCQESWACASLCSSCSENVIDAKQASGAQI